MTPELRQCLAEAHEELAASATRLRAGLPGVSDNPTRQRHQQTARHREKLAVAIGQAIEELQDLNELLQSYRAGTVVPANHPPEDSP